MMFSSVLLHAAMLAFTPAPACNPLPGAQELIERREVRWIVVGEMHGTNETPAAFLDLVCLASRSRPVVVAVEQPVLAQQAIDAFISSDGSPAAKAAFLQSTVWNAEMKDGRSSSAYFRLFEALRRMRLNGRVRRVVAFQPSSYPGPAGFEKLMADTLRSGGGKDELVLALVGNLHARLTPLQPTQTYIPMAGYFSRGEIVTIDVRPNGGSAWTCRADGCGAQGLMPPSANHYRGLVLDSLDADGYTGVLFLGVPATASPPQDRE